MRNNPWKCFLHVGVILSSFCQVPFSLITFLMGWNEGILVYTPLQSDGHNNHRQTVMHSLFVSHQIKSPTGFAVLGTSVVDCFLN